MLLDVKFSQASVARAYAGIVVMDDAQGHADGREFASGDFAADLKAAETYAREIAGDAAVADGPEASFQPVPPSSFTYTPALRESIAAAGRQRAVDGEAIVGDEALDTQLAIEKGEHRDAEAVALRGQMDPSGGAVAPGVDPLGAAAEATALPGGRIADLRSGDIREGQ